MQKTSKYDFVGLIHSLTQLINSNVESIHKLFIKWFVSHFRECLYNFP
jgi:hypothetical protein